MKKLSLKLLLFCLFSVAHMCPWGHINFNKKELPQCDSDLTLEVYLEDGEYTQIPYDVKNTNLSTPFTLSTMNVTKDGVSTIYEGNRFHLHHKSKHLVDHELFDLEIHVIHESQKDGNAVVAVLFKAYPGDFPDPFDNWDLGPSVPVQQKFPLKLSTPKLAYHYDGLPNCVARVKFFIDAKVVRIKESSLEKISKLIEGGKPGYVEDGSYVDTGNVCSWKGQKNRKARSPHHMLRFHD